MTRPLLLALSLAACNAAPQVAPYDFSAPLPGESLYQLDVNLVDQDGLATTLARHRGHPTIVSMFYASCPTACPLLIGDILALEEALPPAVLADARVLLVSLDPDRDDPETLQGVVQTRNLDTSRWTLTRAELADVRLVAASLSISYRALADGEMNHSSILTVLDRDGVPVGQTEGLHQDPTPLVTALSGI